MAGGPLPRSDESAITKDLRGHVWTFQYKPGKKDKNAAKANERAYYAAVQRMLEAHAQYRSDHPGQDVPNYSKHVTRFPQGPPGSNVYQGDNQPVQRGKGGKIIGETPSLSLKNAGVAPKKPKIGIDESVKPKPAVLTSNLNLEHLKTQKLRNQLFGAQSLLDQYVKDAQAGQVPKIAKISPKLRSKGNWLERNIGRRIVGGYEAAAGLQADVVGKAIEKINRPLNATSSEVVYNAKNMQRVDWQGVHSELDKAAKAQGWSQQRKQQELAAYKKKNNVYEPSDPQYVKPATTPLGLNKGALYAARRGITGKEHHDLTEVTMPALAEKFPALRPKPGDSLVSKILKAAPGVGSGFVGSLGIDPMSYGGGIGTSIRGLAEAARVQDTAIATKVAERVPEYAQLLEHEKAADEAQLLYQQSKTAKNLKNVQTAHKIANDFRKQVAPKIRHDALSAGFAPDDIASLGIGKTVERRMAEATHPERFGKEYLDSHTAAESILHEMVNKGRVKVGRGELVGKVSQMGERMAQETGVKDAAAVRTLEKVKELRNAGEMVSSAQKARIMQESIAEQVLPRTEEVRKLLDEALQKRFHVTGIDMSNVPGADKTLRALYMPFEKIGGKIGATETGKSVLNTFSMGAHFPGTTEDIRRMAESHGIVESSDFTKMIRREFSDHINQSEAEQISRAIQSGHPIGNTKLDTLVERAKQLSEDAFNRQVKLGKYKATDKGKNYIFHQYKGGPQKDIAAFKRDRKLAIRAGGQGPSLETAAAQGLNPEKRIDQILVHQHLDMSRSVQRYNFRQGLISNFGVLSDNPEYAKQQGLQEVTGNYLNKPFQDKARLKGAKWYLPPEIHDTFKEMDDLLKAGNNVKSNSFLRFNDKVMRFFKTTTTVGAPSNWVNNTAGDIFMNWIDGVRNPLWYKKSAAMLRLTEDGKFPKYITIGGERHNALDVFDDFKHNAPSGGFIRTEGGPISKLKASRKVQSAYESREEFSRLAHFLHATDEETKKLMQQGMSHEEAYKNAVDRAGRRVAKWNIDYTAITPAERAIRRYAMPFYTFMRKATPLMLESLVTRPGKLVHFNLAKRSLEQLLGVPPAGVDSPETNWPWYVKQSGAVRLTNSDTPNYMRDPTPLNTISRMFGGNKQTDLIGNVANQMNPLAKIPIELLYQRQMYTGAPITDWKQYALNQVAPVSTIARLAGHGLKPSKSSTPSKGKAMNLLNFFGVPVAKVEENQQQSELRTSLAKVKNPMKDFNTTIAPYALKKASTKKSGTYYTVYDPMGKVLAKFRDPNLAMRRAYALYNAKASG